MHIADSDAQGLIGNAKHNLLTAVSAWLRLETDVLDCLGVVDAEWDPSTRGKNA